MVSVSSNDLPERGGSPAYTALPLISRTQHVRDQLEAAIERGDYAPGARLPSERELAELLGVSRVSVREAIRSLEAIGLVEVRHGRGCFVATSRSDRYASSFSHWLSVHHDEVLELLKVRGALDELAAETAAKNGAPEWPQRLRELNARFRAVEPQDIDGLVERDVAFHDAVAEASGSTLLADLLRELHETLNESRRATLLPPGRPAESAREHDAIISAIERGDPNRARAAVAAHLDSVRASLTALLAASETEGNE
jgi:GntR family transcriptional repressor for pyruvate dehydrogenase complex